MDFFRIDWRKITGASGTKYLVFVALSFCLFYVPFLTKAFHIDDAAFINMSKTIGWNPLHARPTDLFLMGGLLKGFLPYEDTHPMLIPYFIKMICAFFDEGEVVLHISFLIFPLMSLVALKKLNDTLFSDSGAAGRILPLLLLPVPAFLVNSHNIMTDVPTLAFLLVSLAAYARGFEKRSAALIYGGGFFMGLAVFTSYQILALMPVVLIYSVLERRSTMHVVSSLIFVVCMMLLWLGLVYRAYGIFPFFSENVSSGFSLAQMVKSGMMKTNLSSKGINIFANLGMSLFFVVMLYGFMRRVLSKILFGSAALTTLIYPVVSGVEGYSFLESLSLAVLVSFGILSLVLLVEAGIIKGERSFLSRNIFLVAWAVIVVGYNLFLPFGAARYLLPALPPIMLVLLNDIKWESVAGRSSAVIGCIIIASFVFGLSSAYSDFRYANAYRDFSGEVKQFRLERKNTFDVWYIGEWGMKYYMDRDGARYLLRTSNEPRKGDFIVIPEMPRYWHPSINLLQRLQFYAVREYSSPLPLRMFNRRSNAGFYEHQWGMLPFAFSREPDELFQIWEVVR